MQVKLRGAEELNIRPANRKQKERGIFLGNDKQDIKRGR